MNTFEFILPKQKRIFRLMSQQSMCVNMWFTLLRPCHLQKNVLLIPKLIAQVGIKENDSLYGTSVVAGIDPFKSYDRM